jgi:lipoprotein-anchoring transpeptidase ErfK/SrfK
MSAARALGFIYLVMASVFGVAIALHQHPALQASASNFGAASMKFAGNYIMRPAASAGYRGLQYADAHLVQPAAHAGYRELAHAFDSLDPPLHVAKLTAKPTVHIAFVHKPLAPRHETELARLTPPPVPPRAIPPRPEDIVPTSPELAAPALPEIKLVPGDNQFAKNVVAPPVLAKRPSLGPEVAVAAPAPLPDASSQPIAPQELTRVVARLKSNLTPELLQNFALFLYVSKAEHGPWAQHMYVFAKQNDGGLDLKYNWLVSTGREKMELNDESRRMGTDTPPGYYQLDPDRIYRHYTSSEWHQPMPYAMFFNWIHDGQQTGLAVHSTAGKDEAAVLGQRASAGCIRLSPANASTLFALIRSEYKGLAPRFAVDRRTGTMSNEGILMHDAQGHVKLAEGYKVLIFIENYSGNDNVVAALF